MCSLAGDLNITTTSASGPALAGNITAIVVSAVVCIVWTWIAPDKDATWEKLHDSLEKKVQILDNAKVGIVYLYFQSMCGSNLLVMKSINLDLYTPL